MSQSAASIHAKLLNHARATGQDFPRVLEQYAIGRLFCRMAASEASRQFVLKGGQLFAVWAKVPHRPTRDLDLLGFGDPTDERLRSLFQALCALPGLPDDGLVWDAAAVQVEAIREEAEYGGKRVQLLALLGKARIALQVDIGFGDAVTPGPVEAEWPGMLGFPPAKLRAYPPETVIAEKLQAAVVLEMFNSRMKDFHDLHWLATHRAFEAQLLARAIRATFDRRGTPVPAVCPVALTPEFADHAQKKTQWAAFLDKSGLPSMALATVIPRLHDFLWPVLESIAVGKPFEATWRDGAWNQDLGSA